METESTGTPTGETRLALVRRARRIDRILAETYPYAVAELDFETPFELLVATVLSAQTTDVRVNAATPALFARFPDAHAMAAATEPMVSTRAQVAPPCSRPKGCSLPATGIVATSRSGVKSTISMPSLSSSGLRMLPGSQSGAGVVTPAR